MIVIIYTVQLWEIPFHFYVHASHYVCDDNYTKYCTFVDTFWTYMNNWINKLNK